MYLQTAGPIQVAHDNLLSYYTKSSYTYMFLALCNRRPDHWCSPSHNLEINSISEHVTHHVHVNANWTEVLCKQILCQIR